MFSTNDFALNRRAFLGLASGGLGSLALAQLAAADRANRADPLAPKPPHRAAKAKAVICQFQHGGPSQMDLFDPKPELTKQHGKPHPDKLEVHFHTQQGKLLASPFQFSKCGKSGVELSELLPHTERAAVAVRVRKEGRELPELRAEWLAEKRDARRGERTETEPVVATGESDHPRFPAVEQ